jgi:Leucine-rich repeat (LRR) protein
MPADALGILKELYFFAVLSTNLVKMTKSLPKLINLGYLLLYNCSLTHIPDLSHLQKLHVLELFGNQLSQLNRIPGVVVLSLDNNLFTEVPMIEEKHNLRFLMLENNFLKTAAPITSYINLEYLVLSNTSLTSIPPNIDKLKKLKYISFSKNKISHVPTNIRNLPDLETLDIHDNLISSDEIRSIQKMFAKSHPNLELYV